MGIMENEKKTCSEYIELVLKNAGRLRNKQIEAAILVRFGQVYQSNTIAKYLSFFINDGKVLSAPTKTQNGVSCEEYYWIGEIKPPIVQVETPCPICGSMYRRGGVCNMERNHAVK